MQIIAPCHEFTLLNGTIKTVEESGLIRVDLARPMNADHIVNSPIIDPIQLGQMK